MRVIDIRTQIVKFYYDKVREMRGVELSIEQNHQHILQDR